MVENEKIRLFTAPSRHVRDDLPLTPKPYQKVIGMQVGKQIRWSASAGHENAEEETPYVVPRLLGRRLLWYFNRYFCEGAYQYSLGRSINCFHFGIWLTRGIAHATAYQALEITYKEAHNTPPATNLQPGDLSVIRAMQDLPKEPVLHGLVMLDTATDSHIQLTTRGGAIGISSSNDALAYRMTPAYIAAVCRDQGINPQTWAVGHFSVPTSLQPDYIQKA